ncbi:IS66 family insertion sequence element accessory protein TnpB [Salinispira pacifica]|uniref:Mobile element protein n=1 Tax=Salinispira pacifica TaxID=1307761 RepID=V5WD79_9SPIO|nr:IS66 family insertion sequence element accessory protein TnpB [Salinispira pacifica]AHC13783.1 Mobile element protein [Salinispira pacifica]AHC15439.1 Mobile element protein [Salinispira pacifica]
MFHLDPAARVWLIPGKTDMRKAVNGLSGIVAHQLALDPMSGQYFVFCGRRRDIIKILYWDRNGYGLWYKRLEVDKFRWPQTPQEARAVSGEQLGWLLLGLDWERAHPVRRY